MILIGQEMAAAPGDILYGAIARELGHAELTGQCWWPVRVADRVVPLTIALAVLIPMCISVPVWAALAVLGCCMLLHALGRAATAAARRREELAADAIGAQLLTRTGADGSALMAGMLTTTLRERAGEDRPRLRDRLGRPWRWHPPAERRITALRTPGQQD